MLLEALFLFARRLDDGYCAAKRSVTLKMKCRVFLKGAMFRTRKKTKQHENREIDGSIPKATVHVRISAFG